MEYATKIKTDDISKTEFIVILGAGYDGKTTLQKFQNLQSTT